MLIRAYGQYWNPDIVDWGKKGPGGKGQLLGKVRLKKKLHQIDFWDAFGIYVLHDEFRAVYVGKAAITRLGPRLRNHLNYRFAGRWDMFSWFSLSKVNVTSKAVGDPGTRYLTKEAINDTIEAISILIADPPLNRKRESMPSASEAHQIRSPHPKTIRTYLEAILKKVDGNGG